MTDERSKEEPLAERLLAEDRGGREPGSARTAAGSDRLVERLLDGEEAFERRVRRAAVGAWSVVLALVPLIAVSVLMLRVVHDGFVRDAVRSAAVVMGILSILGLLLAVLATVAWLFRPRTASLAAIQRRLAALEELLARGR